MSDEDVFVKMEPVASHTLYASQRKPCMCHGSWPLHADDQAAALRALGLENDRLRAGLVAVEAECCCGQRVEHLDEFGNTDYGTRMGCSAAAVARKTLDAATPTKENA